MNSKKFSWKQFRRSFAGKGYYIALILCAIAIGISGYLYYNHTSNTLDTDQPDTPAMATKPSGTVTPVIQTLETGAPLAGETVMVYAMDSLVYNPTTRDWRVHNGIDIAADAGTPVLAAAKGVVHTVYEDETLGTTVVIRHDNGFVTMYASLDKDTAVQVGQTVTLGQTIGTVGNSALLETAIGDHLHFCVTHNENSIDPMEFLELG